MNEPAAVESLTCPACAHGPFAAVAFDRDGDEVANGVLACGECHEWFRIEDGLPELLPPSLRDSARREAFKERYAGRWDGWDAGSRGEAVQDRPGDALKREQIAFYGREASRYDRGITDSHFWRAFDRGFLDEVERAATRRGVLVEIGAGTGRLLPRLAERFRTVVAVDLSEAMARESMRRAPAGVLHVVADAERLPVRSGLADCVVFSGSLGYLGRPDHAIAEGARVLADGGVLCGQENNASVLRPAFDQLMRLRRSWVAKSWPPVGVVSGRDLRAWLEAAGVRPRVGTRVFLPPQVFSILPARAAGWLMRATDAVAGPLPWVGGQGGLLVFAGVRGAAA